MAVAKINDDDWPVLSASFQGFLQSGPVTGPEASNATSACGYMLRRRSWHDHQAGRKASETLYFLTDMLVSFSQRRIEFVKTMIITGSGIRFQIVDRPDKIRCANDLA